MKRKELLKLKFKYTFFSSLLFIFLYKSAEFYAKTFENLPAHIMAWEKNIPFLPIFILPYMTSCIIFVVIFFLSKTKEDLKLLAKRANFITIISVIIFFIYPLKFSFSKPLVENAIYKFLFHLLEIFDSPFNQAPSLHVSHAFLYMIMFYTELKSPIKYLLCFWAFLTAISVLFIYQHHFIDFIGGIFVAITTFLIFRREKDGK